MASGSLLVPVPVVGNDWYSSRYTSHYAMVKEGLFKILKQMGL